MTNVSVILAPFFQPVILSASKQKGAKASKSK